MKTYKGFIKKLEPNQIFVFGSNTQGKHLAGAARWAYFHAGAIYGQSKGLQGQSLAIVTKDLTKTTHPSVEKEYIKAQILELYDVALDTTDKEYLIAYSGAGVNLNGYTPEEMAEMFGSFTTIPSNIVFEEEFYKLIKDRQP